MSFWAKLVKREKKESTEAQLESCVEGSIPEPKVHYEDIPSTLDLE